MTAQCDLLMQLRATGDPDALARLYTHYGPQITRKIAYRKHCSSDLVLDALHDEVIHLAEHPNHHDYDAKTPLELGVRLYRRVWRQVYQKYLLRPRRLVELFREQPDVRRYLLSAEEQLAVREVIHSLFQACPLRAKIVELSVIDGYSVEEIAAAEEFRSLSQGKSYCPGAIRRMKSEGLKRCRDEYVAVPRTPFAKKYCAILSSMARST